MPLQSTFHRLRGLVTATLAALPAITLLAQDATLDSLGFLPGHVRSEARGISADGSVVVGRCATTKHWIFGRDSSERAFVWTQASGMTQLEGLVATNSRNFAAAVSADAAVIVGEAVNEAGALVPVIWNNQEIEPLAIPVSGASAGGAMAVSGDGRTILGFARIPGPGVGVVRRVPIRWKDGAQNLDLGNLHSLSDALQSSVSHDGSTMMLRVGNEALYRWQHDTGAVQLRVAPSTHKELSEACDCAPGILLGIGLSGDGTRMIGTSGRRVIEWRGFGDGTAIPLTTVSNSFLSWVVANRTGQLIAGTERTHHSESTNRGAFLLAPYGTMPLRSVLAAQGANVSSFASLTNVTAISPDGQWLVGSGRSTASGYPEAFRAKLILHADGEPQVATETIVPDDGMPFDRLRWPVRDLLVVVESRPVLHPAVSWAAESGEPRIEGASIVLDLPKTTEQRFYRLRRVE